MLITGRLPFSADSTLRICCRGDGKFKFGVGAYLTSRYETAALYAGNNYALMDYSAFKILKVDKIEE